MMHETVYLVKFDRGYYAAKQKTINGRSRTTPIWRRHIKLLTTQKNAENGVLV